MDTHGIRRHVVTIPIRGEASVVIESCARKTVEQSRDRPVFRSLDRIGCRAGRDVDGGDEPISGCQIDGRGVREDDDDFISKTGIIG